MQYRFIEKNKNNFKKDFTYIFEEKDLDKNETYYELVLSGKKYCFSNFCQDFYFEADKILIINMWNKIVIFSIENGEILFYSGLFDAFVGVERLKDSFVVVTDTTIFKINKTYFFVYDFNSIQHNILDFQISDSLEEIIIKFVDEEMQDDMVLKI
ncbi:hypothetical protein [Flavobacterium davisii]|uniref:hypothetical protein n=1 Tax=Flavobacterium davisii TaxID=2906077 RepID=UPI0035D127DF